MKAPADFERLKGLLKDKDPAARSCAAEVELAWLDLGAAGEMGGLLRDENVRTRGRAAGYFLALYKDLDTPHVDMLLADPDPGVRKTAVEITIREKDATQKDRLVAMLKDDPDEQVRRLAADSLAKCCPEAAVGPLADALDDRSDAVAAASAGHLGDMKAASALEKLAALLPKREKPSDELVEKVARALADIGGTYDANVLLPYINWDNLYVVRAVIKAWDISATPADTKIKDALRRYLDMPVDGRYKEYVKKLLEKLG
jgi:HEAT repeat protein